jgi:dolichol-phosphate mannosyltransferase
MPPLELAIVVPTFNERKNIQELFRRLPIALAGIHYEVIFVDGGAVLWSCQTTRSMAAPHE